MQAERSEGRLKRNEAIRERQNGSPEADAHPESGDVSRLVGRDGGELLGGDARRSEARIGKVRWLELGERLLIKIGLELLEQLREYWQNEVGSIHDQDHLYAKVLRTECGRGTIVDATAERRSRHGDGRNSNSY